MVLASPLYIGGPVSVDDPRYFVCGWCDVGQHVQYNHTMQGLGTLFIG